MPQILLRPFMGADNGPRSLLRQELAVGGRPATLPRSVRRNPCFLTTRLPDTVLRRSAHWVNGPLTFSLALSWIGRLGPDYRWLLHADHPPRSGRPACR